MSDFRNALLKVIKPGGVAGNGFLLHNQLVVTCAHVVAEAIGNGCDKTQAYRPEALIDVEFTFTEDRDARTAEVVDAGWFPAVECQDGCFDIAILKLRDPPPHDAEPLRLASAQREEFRVRLKPFVPGLGRSPDVKAQALSRDEFKELQVNAIDDRTQWIEPGVSGAPVFADDGGELVEGMVVWRDTQNLQAFLKPADILQKALPNFDEATLSRYALDVDEDRREYARRDLATFEIFAPSQTAREGEGVAVQFEASFDRFGRGGPRIREVVLEITSPQAVSDRAGFDEPIQTADAHIVSRGARDKPYWRITAQNEALTECNFSIDTPPLFRLADPKPGTAVQAEMVTYVNCEESVVDVDDLIKDAEVSTMRKRFLERLALKDLGDPDDAGRVVLGRVTSVVREID